MPWAGCCGLDDGQLDAERLLIPLPDAKGKIAAWCLALPFLRPAEVTGAHLGDDYLARHRPGA